MSARLDKGVLEELLELESLRGKLSALTMANGDFAPENLQGYVTITEPKTGYDASKLFEAYNKQKEKALNQKLKLVENRIQFLKKQLTKG